MSTSNLLNAQFDDSEDEEDFNPAPADLSDDEGAEDADASKPENISRPNNDDAEEEKAPIPGKRQPIQDNVDEDEDEDDQADEDPDEDDEDDEDDEEEEITVRAVQSRAPSF